MAAIIAQISLQVDFTNHNKNRFLEIYLTEFQPEIKLCLKYKKRTNGQYPGP